MDRHWQYLGPCRIGPGASGRQGRQDRRHRGSPMIGVSVGIGGDSYPLFGWNTSGDDTDGRDTHSLFIY